MTYGLRQGEEWSSAGAAGRRRSGVVRGWLSHRQRRTSKASSKFSFWRCCCRHLHFGGFPMRSERRSLKLIVSRKTWERPLHMHVKSCPVFGARCSVLHCCCKLLLLLLWLHVAAVANIAAQPVAWLRLAAGFLCQPPACLPA